jgi:serine/threonine-protein kinase
MRRAQAVARLRHPNLVRMLPLPGGAGLSPVLGNARRLADFTLPAGTFKRFDLEQVVRLMIDVLSGLSALHDVVTDGEPFVHGSVSPQHIYIDEHGTARLVPLLPAHFSSNAKLERTGYVAPERLLGQPADVRADVFSVGVMLWEALAGKRLSADGSLSSLLTPGEKLPPIRLSPRLRWAQPLCAVAERAVAVEPAARFQTALELSQAIEAVAAQQLARVDSDAWQEEAPTPVFQPRLHLATLRASTPPPAVLTLPPAVAAEEPKAPSERAVVSSTAPLDEPFAAPPRRRARALGWGLGALALGLAFALVPGRARQVPSWAQLKAAAAGAPVAAAARFEPLPSPVMAPTVASASAVAVVPPSAASLGAAPSSAPATPLVAPSVSAAPTKKSSVVAPRVPVPSLKTPAKPREHREDYGI